MVQRFLYQPEEGSPPAGDATEKNYFMSRTMER
jgi:hypothetical protein